MEWPNAPTAGFRWLAVLAGLMAPVCVFAQGASIPVGNWQSPQSATYTNPALTGAELYLNIDVARDGSFSGRWGQYLCNAFPGALGISIYSCSALGGDPVSGRLGADGRGTITLDKLGRTAFRWTASADAVAFDLPKDWVDSDAVLYQARLTRDGKREEAPPAPTRDDGPLLSAIALFREFEEDPDGATARYTGRTLTLEGRRANLIPLSDGGAAIHILDGFARAVVLFFARAEQVAGIEEGATFRFTCAFMNFDYQYVQMDDCSIVRD